MRGTLYAGRADRLRYELAGYSSAARPPAAAEKVTQDLVGASRFARPGAVDLACGGDVFHPTGTTGASTSTKSSGASTSTEVATATDQDASATGTGIATGASATSTYSWSLTAMASAATGAFTDTGSVTAATGTGTPTWTQIDTATFTSAETSVSPTMNDPSVSNGWATSGLLHGYWYTLNDNVDGGTSTIHPPCPETCFMFAGSSICVQGEGAAVPDENSYAVFWGAVVGWNLNQAEAPPNDPAGASLMGYRTVAIGLRVNTPAPMRAKLYLGDATNYCCASVINGTNLLDLRSDFTADCWSSGGATLTEGQLGSVVAIEIHVPTTLGSPTPFDFCVTGVTFE